MFPVLLRFPEFLPLIGGRGIHTYGLMIALGFLLGMMYVRHESERIGLNVDKVMDLFFWVMVSGLAGSRLMYVLNSVSHFWDDPLVLFRVWEGGLVFQGGVLGALPVAIWFLRRHKIPFFKVADVFTPPLSLGHALGRIGCFFAGCCFGRHAPEGFFLAIVFPDNPDTVAPHGVPLYPTQLMESFGEFAIFIFLLYYRKKKPFDGSVFLFYLMIYSVLRSVVELFRGDTVRGFIIDPYLSIAQFISALMIIGAVFCWVYLKKRSSRA